jgi:hypothetical protein
VPGHSATAAYRAGLSASNLPNPETLSHGSLHPAMAAHTGSRSIPSDMPSLSRPDQASSGRKLGVIFPSLPSPQLGATAPRGS